MHLIFYKTSDVFAAEEKLQEQGVMTKIVPTPVQDKAYCGVCVKIREADLEVAKTAIGSMEYKVV